MSWRPLARLAWRDVVRARGRSLLVMVMIMLPVLAVTAADVVIHTARVSGVESLDRRLGAAQAWVRVEQYAGRVEQGVDPEAGLSVTGDGGDGSSATLAEVREVLGGSRPVLERHEGSVRVTTDGGAVDAVAHQTDLADPLATGLFRLTEGSLPDAAGEVGVNRALAERGPRLGEQLVLDDGTSRTVVGIVESTTLRDVPVVTATPGGVLAPGDGQRGWLVGGSAVTWDDVLRLNRIGTVVTSRAVLLDPPPPSEVPIGSPSGGVDRATLAVLALIVVMALIEVVLLAGPAFAVGARRQARTLALMAAGGGTPRQARTVILAGGAALGGLAALAGVGLGVAAGWALLPAVQSQSSTWLGPFEVPWLQLLGIGAFGLLSAVLAAVVPAWTASRQDVVAVLAGRRGDRRPSVRSPLVGVLLVAVGAAGSAYGALGAGSGELVIAGSAVVAVVGMILMVPVVLTLVARAGRRAWLPLRYAVRDAARHRTRTVPAVAAVAATVAGVVALGVGAASDQAENEATYTPSLPLGVGAVSGFGLRPEQWQQARRAVEQAAPDAEIAAVRGVQEWVTGRPESFVEVSLQAPGAGPLFLSSQGAVGSATLVSAGELPAVLDVSEADRAAAEEVLHRGGAVVFTGRTVRSAEVRMRLRVSGPDGTESSPPVTVPARFVRSAADISPAQAVLAPQAASALGATVVTTGLVVRGGLSVAEEEEVAEAVAAVSPDISLYVERGFQQEDSERIVLLVLGGLGAVLMLGGTLTATFLALSDARADLATLSAVGATPRTRRAVAAAYAVVVGLVGALLGAVVGFIPGVAVTYPLTGGAWTGRADAPATYLDVPWLLVLGLVVVLPLLTAAVVGLCARSRLPMVARLD